jgi:hypothetical protein
MPLTYVLEVAPKAMLQPDPIRSRRHIGQQTCVPLLAAYATPNAPNPGPIDMPGRGVQEDPAGVSRVERGEINRTDTLSTAFGLAAA